MSLAPPFVLIDDARPDGGDGAWLFTAPERVIVCDDPDGADAALAEIEAELNAGRHVAGYAAYETGYALEPKLAPLMPAERDGPLMWFGVFDAPARLDADAVRDLMDAWAADDHAVTLAPPAVNEADYIAHVRRVKAHIRAGDVYQINYTFTQPFTLTGSPLSLYARLRGAQRAGYGALVHTGETHVLSLSPELFVERDGACVTTRPMKGTAPRRADPREDADERAWLAGDEKSRAENLMIVDLLRNDVGRIARIGTVKAEPLFHVETFPTVHQMTSTVTAALNDGVGFAAMMRALFPCGSITGAPKVKAMELIRALEDTPRGVYTGAVGFAGPGPTGHAEPGTARFNVAIRTLVVDGDGRGTMGIGSGIVHDSDPAREWAECHLKARFLTRESPAFDLLETLKWSPDGGFALLDRHLDRLVASAAYFGYPLERDAVVAALHDAVAHADAPQRVRLTVDGWGVPAVTTRPLPASGQGAWRVAVVPAPTDPNSPFTYHKTTHRAALDDAREAARRAHGVDEVLFATPAGALTEGSYTNLFAEIDGRLLTPPLGAGLLAGTLRGQLLDDGRARESALTPADLKRADRVFLGNSVRGLVPAQLIDIN